MNPRNLVILGANSDIGKMLVARSGAVRSNRVLAVSRTPARRNLPSGIVALSGIDLAKEADLRQLALTTDRLFTKPFAVIHCVGDFWIHKPLVKTPYAEMCRMVESQFITLLGAARFLTPIMKRKGGGRVVAFSCNSVGYSYPDMSPFTASKAAIESFVKCYANEHAAFGISACALALPTIRTAKVLKAKPTGDHKNYITPKELADYILNHVLAQPHEVNGNVLKVFKHSRTFYHKSYYERNPWQKLSRIHSK